MKKKLTAILAAAMLLNFNFANADKTDNGAASVPAEINHEDSIYFAAPDFYNMTSSGSLIILPQYPTFQQTTEYTSGPAAALTVLRYYDNNFYDEMKIAAEMKSQAYPIGTSLSNMVKFFEKIGWKVQSSLNSKPLEGSYAFKDFVIENLKNGRPIMVENVEFGGIWRVIIGYDSMGTDSTFDDVLIFADPYDTSDHKQDGYAIGSARHFLAMWFDHSMLPKKERTKPFIVASPS